MMKQLIIALGCAGLLLTPRPAHASDPDPWFGRDKWLHFSASAALAGVGYAGSSLVFESRTTRAAVGGGFALSAGITKELVDLGGGGHASMRDLTWNLLGTLVGVGLSLLVDSLLSPSSDSRTSFSPSSLQGDGSRALELRSPRSLSPHWLSQPSAGRPMLGAWAY
ncbi:MAG: hypothetical protein KIT72_19460 [Polyangiaceae bacterium]|nr:hypothetical protein [Polyangiaceae bacterium]MCW5792599.1 hypothetical protein [Polyangiaceae bacterium]